MFDHDLSFWIAVVGAIVIKILTGPGYSLLRGAVTVIIAVFVAYEFTDVTLHIFKLDPDPYKAPVAALLALTGEGLVRWLITAAQSPLKTLGEGLKAWRGGK